MNSIGSLTFLVRDYDEAIRFFTEKLGFWLVEDTRLSPEKRWVLVAPSEASETRLLLAKAATPEQEKAVRKLGKEASSNFLNRARQAV